MRGGLHSWNHPGASKYARSSTFGIRARHGYGINGSKVVYTGRGRHDGRSGLDREWHDGRSGLNHIQREGGFIGGGGGGRGGRGPFGGGGGSSRVVVSAGGIVSTAHHLQRL